MRRSLCQALVWAGVAGAVVFAQQAAPIYVDMYTLGAFSYMPPSSSSSKTPKASTVPSAIKSLDGKRVAVEGFMIPYDQSSGQVTDFMLVASMDACGFGDYPARMNDWVDVHMKGNKTAYASNAPVTVTGAFSVGELFDKVGYMVSLYRLEADAVSGAPKPW